MSREDRDTEKNLRIAELEARLERVEAALLAVPENDDGTVYKDQVMDAFRDALAPTPAAEEGS